MAGPVEGIKVVELGVWVAGPAAGGILADWGADVIKIEPPSGDPGRMFGRMLGCDLGVNPPFEMDNRSKRSVVLDLTADAGRDTAFELLSDADVFLTNVRPGALQRLGMDFESVSARNPRLVYGLITGYGEDRARRRPGRLRRGRVLVPRRRGPPAHPARRHAAVPARWHGRPLGRHDPGRRRVRGAARPRTHRDGPAGHHLAVPPGCLHRELRPQHLPAHRAAHRDRTTRIDGQPVHEQLHRRRRTALLDRRSRGRAPLARAVPGRGTPRLAAPIPASATPAPAPPTRWSSSPSWTRSSRPARSTNGRRSSRANRISSGRRSTRSRIVVADEQFHAAGGIVDVPDGESSVADGRHAGGFPWHAVGAAFCGTGTRPAHARRFSPNSRRAAGRERLADLYKFATKCHAVR